MTDQPKSLDHEAAVELIAATLGNGAFEHWAALAQPLANHLTRQERARLAFAALYGLHPEDWGSIMASVANVRADLQDRFPAPVEQPPAVERRPEVVN